MKAVFLEDVAYLPLSPQQGRVLRHLMDMGHVPLETLYDLIWPDPDDLPDQFMRQVHRKVYVIRKRLRPGWAIVNRGYGLGYELRSKGD